jgi:transcriptional regulator with XRE-family HTH domain
MARDDLDKFIADRTKKNPNFPDLIKAAEARRALAKKLGAARKRLSSQSQTSIAAAMGTSPSIVSRLENGADVRLSTLQKYAAVLDCDLEIELVPKAR